MVKHGLKPHKHSLVIGVVVLENTLLRQPLSVVERQIKRPCFTAQDRFVIL